jgi:anti-sigma factor RsiW
MEQMWRPESVYDERGHLDEGVIHAWLDGALERDAAREVEAHAEACVTCSARVSEARGLIAGASRVLGALDGAPGVARGVAPGVSHGVAPDISPDMRVTSAVDAGNPSTSRKHRWWATRTMGLAAAAVFVFAAGSVVLRDQLGGSGGVREAIMADQASAPERAAVAGESAFAAPSPAADASGSPASSPAADESRGRAAAPAAEESGSPASARAVDDASAPAQGRGLTPAPASPVAPMLAAVPASDFSAPTASAQAAESAARREAASMKGITAPRVPARAPAAAVQLRGKVGGADSRTGADSATRRMWQDHPMQPAAMAGASAGNAAESDYAVWMGRCWRRSGSDTLYRFAHPSAHRDSTAVHAPDRGRPAWMPGHRLLAGSTVGPFEWRAEPDSSGVRIRMAGRRSELRLRAVGDSLLEGEGEGGERVRLAALPGSCP